MRKRLPFLLVVATAIFNFLQLQAQDPYLPQQAEMGTTLAPGDFPSFAPAGDYTFDVELTTGTSIDARNELGVGFEYVTTADGAYRFAVRSGKVYTYRDSVYVEKFLVKTFTDRVPEFPAIYAEADDAIDRTGIYNEANLFKNPGFETPANPKDVRSATDVRWLPFGWQSLDFKANCGNSRVNDVTINSGFSAITPNAEGLGVLMFHQYENNFYQEFPAGTIKNKTWYEAKFRTWTHTGGQKGGTYFVRVGTTPNGSDIYSYSFTQLDTDYGMQDISCYFRTGETTANAPVYFTIYRATSGKIAHFDRMTLTEATTVPVMNGLTFTGGDAAEVKYADGAFAPVTTLAAGEYYDMTDYVTNASVISGEGWLGDNSTNSGQQYPGAPDNTYLDKWSGSAYSYNVYQTLEGIPNGSYTIIAAARSNGDAFSVYAEGTTSGSQPVINNGSTNGALGNGWNDITVSGVQVLGNTLTFGVKGQSPGNIWIGSDNYRLHFYGTDFTALKELLTEKKDSAIVLQPLKMAEAAGASLTTAITNATAVIDADPTTLEAIENANKQMDAAIKAANASIGYYKSLNAAIELANTNKANYTELPGLANFETAIGIAQGVYETAKADSTGIAQAIGALKKAEVTCRFTADLPINATFLLQNPNFEAFTGWVTDNTSAVAGDFKISTANGKTCWNSWSNNFTRMSVYQNLEGIPAGVYTVSCYTATDAAPHDQHAYVTTSVGTVVSPVATVQTTATPFATNAQWEQLTTVQAIVGEDGKMVIGFASTSGGQASGWFCVTGFELTCVSKLNAPDFPATVKPVTTGEYVVYHPASGKYLSNNTAVSAPVLNDYGYIAAQDAYFWNITVSGENNDTIMLQQHSSQKYMNANASNTYGILLGNVDAANVSKWALTDVKDGYNFSARRAASGKLVGVDGLTGNNVGIYYDKGTDKNPLFQFITKEAFLAYVPLMEYFNAKEALKAALALAAERVGLNPAAYSAEATTAFNEVIEAARTVYFNEQATLQEVLDVAKPIVGATNKYLMSVVTGTEDAPSDVSFVILNPDFNAGNARNWEGATGAAANTVYEFFAKSFDMYQKIAGLPAGYYQLGVQAFARATGNDKGVAYKAQTEVIRSFLYGKSGTGEERSAPIQSLYSEENTGADANMGNYANSMAEANTAFQNGNYTDNLVDYIYLAEDDTLFIGVKYPTTPPISSSWTIFDNFTLKYKGNTSASLVKLLEEVIAEAKTIQGVMQLSVEGALADSITAAEGLVASVDPTQEALTEAKTKLENRMRAALSSIDAYALLNAAIVRADSLSVAEEEEMVAALATATGIYEASEVDETGINQAIIALKTTSHATIVAKAVNGNVTELMINPTIIQTATSVQVRPLGWENSKNSGTNGNFTKSAASATVPAIDTYLEIWNSNAATIVFDYNQKIQYVPSGVYRLSAVTFTQSTNGNAVLYANAATAPMKSGVTGDNFKTQPPTSLMVTVSDDTLRVGIRTIGVLNGQWSGADDFKLTYLGTEEEAAALLEALKELSDSIVVAEGLITNSDTLIAQAEKNTLTAAITTGKTALGAVALTEVEAAIATLSAAILDARASIELCTGLIAVYEEANTLLEEREYAPADGDAMRTALTENYAVYEDQTDETDNAAIQAAKEAIEAALDIFKSKLWPVGLNDAGEDTVKIYVDGFKIVVEGAEYEIYDQNGLRMPADSPLTPGVYLVNVSGKTVKVQVQ